MPEDPFFFPPLPPLHPSCNTTTVVAIVYFVLFFCSCCRFAAFVGPGLLLALPFYLSVHRPREENITFIGGEQVTVGARHRLEGFSEKTR